MKRLLLLILLCFMSVALLVVANKKNNEPVVVVENNYPPTDYIDEGKYQPPRKHKPVLSFAEKNGLIIRPPEAMPVTETWEDGYFPQLHAPNPSSPYVTVRTDAGDITMVLYPEAAPLTVKNFIIHCQNGYYDGTIFHRVVKDFMMQGGDPLGNGMGGESVYGAPFRDEINDHLHHFKGAVAMANLGAYMNGSQFYIIQGDQFKNTYKEEKAIKYKTQMMINKYSTKVYNKVYDYMFFENPTESQLNEKTTKWINESNDILKKGYVPEINIDRAMEVYPEVGGSPHLDNQYTVFGQVVSGMEVVDYITSMEGKNENGEPFRIESTTVKNAPKYN